MEPETQKKHPSVKKKHLLLSSLFPDFANRLVNVI
jgi:hypothetical protein